MIDDQQRILTMISHGDPLKSILEAICRMVESCLPDHVAAIMTKDPETGCMGCLAAPSLSQESSTPGDEPLVCWTFPMTSRAGEVLGTLALYSPDASLLEGDEVSLLETSSQLASLAIEWDDDRRQQSENEQRYRSLYSANPDPVFSVDVHGRYTGMNAAGLELIGMDETEALGKHFTLGMHADDEAMVRRRFAATLDGAVQRFEVRIWATSGELLELDVIALPILINNEVAGVFGIAKDLRAFNAARRDLLERNQFFSLSSEMFCMINLPGIFVQVNPAFVSVLGYSTEELVGSPYMDLIHPADRPAAKEAIHRLLKGEIVSALDLRVRHADNRIVSLELSAAVGADGLIYVVARDVTRQRQYETTLGRHQMLFQIAGQIARVGGWVFDIKSDELLLSDEVCALHGIEAGTVLKLADVYRLYLPEYHGVLQESLETCVKEGKPYELKVQAIDALGRGMWVRISGRPVLDQDGRTTHIQGALQDITSEIEAVESLQAMAERLRKILESITDGFYALDNQWCFTYVNPQAERILSSKAEDMYGRNVWELFPEAVGTVLYQQYHDVLTTGGTRHFEHFYPPVQRWLDISVYPGEGGLAVFFRDVSERKRHEQQLEKMVGELAYSVSHDSLTGLPNRHIFEDRLRQCRELCLRHDRQMAVLFVDLDDFKPINDSLGHVTGDRVLKKVARRVEAAIRTGDTAARIGGDEFIVLLPDLAQEDDVLMVAERIMEEIARPCDIEGIRLRMTASIGITVADGSIEDPVQLIRQADLAMYKAKQLGRNHYQWFTEDMDQRILERLQMRADLQRAVENREFEVYYQPQIAVRTGQLCGMEALLRWRHPEKGMVPPDQFIPLAESTGQIVALSEWVMATACRDACRLSEQGLGGYPVAVNVSPLHFQRVEFLPFVQRVLTESGMDPSLLELEVTEGLLLNNTEQAIATLADLKTIGLKIAIDDFGTGFSSLGYLKRLPIDKIKIDKSFIDEVISDPRDAAIVQSIIGMAHNLGLKVIAEGVETMAQQAYLHTHDCDLIQGYLHARPMPFDGFVDWARQHKQSTVLKGH